MRRLLWYPTALQLSRPCGIGENSSRVPVVLRTIMKDHLNQLYKFLIYGVCAASMTILKPHVEQLHMFGFIEFVSQ